LKEISTVKRLMLVD